MGLGFSADSSGSGVDLIPFLTLRLLNQPSNTVVRLHGHINANDGKRSGEVKMRQYLLPKTFDITMYYGTNAWDPLRFSVAAKQSWPILDPHLLVGFKHRLTYGYHRKEVTTLTCVELTRKFCHFCGDEGPKMKLGYDIRNREAYATFSSRLHSWRLIWDHRGSWKLQPL